MTAVCSPRHRRFLCALFFSSRSAPELGGEGAGGEYTLQKGFGWTNGVALDLLLDYGSDKDFTLESLLRANYLLPEMVRGGKQAGTFAIHFAARFSRCTFSLSLPLFDFVVRRGQAAFVDVSPMLPPHPPHTVTRPPADTLNV